MLLLEYWKIALCALIQGLGNRERGNHHDWLGTQGARALFWAAPLSLELYLLTSPELVLVGRVFAMAMLGYVLLPHGAGQDLDVPWKTPDSATCMDRIARPERLGYLWLAGMGRFLFLETALKTHSPIDVGWLVLGGLAIPIGYFIGLYMPMLKWRLTTKQEWGELWSGLIFGLFYAIRVSYQLPALW